MSRIVVGVDGSSNSEQALAWALERAATRGARVEAVHAWQVLAGDNLYGIAAIDPQALEDAATVLLDRIVESATEARATVPVDRLVVPGTAAEALLDQGKGADLLVVGSRGRGGFSGLLLGSVSHQVVQHAPCPVVVVPDGRDERPKRRIVAGVDDSRGARDALAWAVQWARAESAELDAVLAYDSQLSWIDVGSDYEEQWRANARAKAEAALREIVDDLDLGDGPVVHQVVEDGPAARVLIDRSKDADLVVVGTRGRGGFAGLLLGSVSQRCAEHARCPVAVVPPSA